MKSDQSDASQSCASALPQMPLECNLHLVLTTADISRLRVDSESFGLGGSKTSGCMSAVQRQEGMGARWAALSHVLTLQMAKGRRNGKGV